jgi:hypothetical protein
LATGIGMTTALTVLHRLTATAIATIIVIIIVITAITVMTVIIVTHPIDEPTPARR